MRIKLSDEEYEWLLIFIENCDTLDEESAEWQERLLRKLKNARSYYLAGLLKKKYLAFHREGLRWKDFCDGCQGGDTSAS
ncbi:MAG: hypothetical protein QW587_04835 [Candidatus Bathyarchaeia archaeon]